ncbi:MAG: hypothetical protein JWP09_943 [Candidatus Taylorbacteria bacterium]|nr:hypothetical protein [Candidatus Taylorbacteria bacterium]
MKVLKKILKILGYIILSAVLIIALALFIVSFKKPSNDKVWDSAVKVLPEISFDKNKVTIKNLRDFSYSAKDKINKEEYYKDVFDTEKIKDVYFLVNPFDGHPSFAHTFFSFVFSDGKTVSVSIEARKEVGESYSSIKGILNDYELSILWGSEKDFLSRRAVYFDEDLYRYKLQVGSTTAKSLFMDMLDQTIKTESQPRFYNTITDNCTNLLADSANRVNPGSVPWTWARIFTGRSPEVLYDLKLIENDPKGFEYVEQQSDISPLIRKIISGNPGLTKFGFSNIPGIH